MTRTAWTYANVETLEAVAGGCTERDELGTSVGDTDLEVPIRVFLLEDNTNGLLDVDKETTRGSYALLVMGHAPGTVVPLFSKRGCSFWVVAMRERLRKSEFAYPAITKSRYSLRCKFAPD